MNREKLEELVSASRVADTCKEILERSCKREFYIKVGDLTTALRIEEGTPEHGDLDDLVRRIMKKNEKTIETADSGDIATSNHSCDDCKFVIRGGEEDNDECDGSHPVGLAAGDFLCNRWEKSDDT